jgi:hypothetical protein
MQQSAEKENWNEDIHKENRRKMALKKRYIMMGLATVGGSLVIGLSARLLAPMIGAGLAAGFTTIGVASTSGFLASARGAAIITSSAATSGGIIAIRAVVWCSSIRPFHQLDASMPNWTSNSYNICQLDVQFICHSLVYIYKESSPLLN